MSVASTSPVGRVLDGRYRVLSHIADGGMASVYVALDLRLDREVALKVMRHGLVGDEAFVTRFRREARSAARLSHPHVVAVYDQGEDEGDMFLAMELVNGHTLREVMQTEGPLTPRAALDILDPVLQALGAAHAAGLIHRDVKPENVILREDGTVKVADFGLARAITSATATAATGTLLGTVAYLSPEQVERGVADARSDVYAAGLLLFEMLTGTKAFTGDNPIHVAYQHVHGSVPAPSSRVPTVPHELDALVALATSRDPDQRPADAGDFLARLRQTRRSLSPAQLDLRPTYNGVAAPTLSATMALPPTAALRPGETSAGTSARRGPQPQRGALPARRTPDPSGRRRWWPWAAVLLLLVLAGVASWFFLSGPGAQTTVPRLVGLSQQQAQQALDRSHLRSTVHQSFDETVKPGTVIVADPAAGQHVGRNTAVALTVSKGPERYAVPTLTGHSQAEAQQRLTDAHLALGKVSGAYSETVAQGEVVSTDPAAGTRLKPGAKVALVVSKGRQPITVTDWTGKPADQATAALTDAGLKVDATQSENSDSVPKGAVISQSPAGGTLFRGDQVTLVVSKGPQMVQVPDVQGQQQDQAAKALRALGFQVDIRKILGGVFGTVRLQDPSAGTMAPKGSTVTLTVV